jgi:hypothetical protein
MLWRTGYQTSVSEKVPLSVALSPGLYIGIYSIEGLKDAEIWRRMIAEEFSPPQMLLIGEVWDPELIDGAFSRSTRPFLNVQRQPEDWKVFDRLGKTFALVVQGTEATLTMWGPPTEDAWDAFAEAARKVLGR